MRTFLILFLCLGIVLPSFGCSCFFEPMSVKKMFNYDLVFLGKVIKEDRGNNDQKEAADGILTPFMMEDIAYTFLVKEVIKGKITEKEITLYTPSSGAACGTSFEVGASYYVFSFNHQNEYRTGLCANNQRQSSVNKAYKKIICQYKKKKKSRNWKNINGQSIASGEIKKINGERVPVGSWTFYHPDGSLESMGFFTEGKKQDTWHYYLDTTSSKAKITELTEKQKLEVKQPENLLIRREEYEDGIRKKVDYLWE